MTLTARILPRRELMLVDRDAMFRLMDRHYENMQRAKFDTDLSEKDWVILFHDGDSGRLCGFSTQMLLSVPVEGRAVRIVFSGDTIIDREHWGTRAMAIAWGKLAVQLIDRYAGEELYWYLISKGFRTYRFLPVYFRDFFPRYDAPTPPRMQAVLEAVGTVKFAERFEPVRGIVRATAECDRLRSGVGLITPERLLDPHVRFFQDRNPGHARGDELCCLAPLTMANFSHVSQRLIHSAAFTRQQFVG